MNPQPPDLMSFVQASDKTLNDLISLKRRLRMQDGLEGYLIAYNRTSNAYVIQGDAGMLSVYDHHARYTLVATSPTEMAVWYRSERDRRSGRMPHLVGNVESIDNRLEDHTVVITIKLGEGTWDGGIDPNDEVYLVPPAMQEVLKRKGGSLTWAT